MLSHLPRRKYSSSRKRQKGSLVVSSCCSSYTMVQMSMDFHKWWKLQEKLIFVILRFETWIEFSSKEIWEFETFAAFFIAKIWSKEKFEISMKNFWILEYSKFVFLATKQRKRETRTLSMNNMKTTKTFHPLKIKRITILREIWGDEEKNSEETSSILNTVRQTFLQNYT